MSSKPKVVYAAKSFRDSKKNRYAIGDSIKVESLDERDLKHYLDHGMVTTKKPVVPNETKPIGPSETKNK